MPGKPEPYEGHEIIDPGIRDETVKALLEAYADEWIAGYYYMLTSTLIQGPQSEAIAKHFQEEAHEEITKHATAIADRLQQLGAEPPKSFQELWALSPCKYPELPDDPFDIEGFIIAAIKAEICAINQYKRLYQLTHGKDPVTEELAEELLVDETRHRTELVGLLSREGLERLKRELG